MNGLSREEIKYLRNKGNKIFVENILFFYLENNPIKKSFVISTPRSIGCACLRNKIRRRFKNAFFQYNLNGKILCIIKNKNIEYSWDQVIKITEMLKKKIINNIKIKSLN